MGISDLCMAAVLYANPGGSPGAERPQSCACMDEELDCNRVRCYSRDAVASPRWGWLRSNIKSL